MQKYLIPVNVNLRIWTVVSCYWKNHLQYWTTFSGYYREIRNICHQISLPFAKDQILQVYENITEFYRTLMEEMTNSNKYTENMQNELKVKFDKLINVIDLILANREK